MRCPECGAENRESARFCGECGSRLAFHCPECGAEIAPDLKFCDQCGARLGQPAPSEQPGEAAVRALRRLAPREFAERLLATRGQTVRERRIVTMLFSDVKGSTPIAEQLDPEEYSEIMDGAMDLLIEPITRYEGALAALMGDGILAFFGAPIAHEDDAERACRAALAILEGAQQYAARLETERGIAGFNVRVGIHTGLVVVGEVGSDLRVEYTAMGDAVNTAARMEEAAEPGTVLITEDTHRLIAPLFETEALGPIRVKGKARPITVHRVLAPKAVAGKPRGIAGIESPLVGREAELSALLQALERLREGIGGVVTIAGEAGIGKSRLVAELRKVARPLNLRWLEGRCLSYGESIVYLPWLDVLRSFLRVTGDDVPALVQERLRDRVQSLRPDQFRHVYPYLARLMSLPLEAEYDSLLRSFDAETLKRNSHQAVQMFLEGVVREGPLVLVCEDLHWADPSSLELLEQVMALTDRAPLLLIAVFRPYAEHRSQRVRQLAARLYRHRHTDVWLEPLSAADSEVLVGNLLHVEALPRPLRMRILDHAEGNPFYMEEVIRSLMDNGVIVYDEATAQWQAMQRVDHIAIPDTLQGVLMARIDRLEEEARRVLQMASVVGRIFLYRVLAAIADEERTLEQHLSTLQREEMIRERARVPDLEYIFKHQLTQEAAYNGLLRRERRRFHRQVAEALERLYPDRIEEQLGLLAHHWESAREPERAVEYLRRAGEQAAAQFANAEAVGYLGRALELTPQEDLAGRYELLLARQDVQVVQGTREERWEDLMALQVLAKALQDDQKRAEVALRQARHARWVARDYPVATAFARRAIQLARAVGDVGIEAGGYREWADAELQQGDVEAFRSRIERGITLAHDAGLRRTEADCTLALRDFLLFQQCDFVNARACAEQVLDIYQELGDRRQESMARLNVGFAALGQGDCDVAKACYEQAVQGLREVGDRWEEGHAYFIAGNIYTVLGAYDAASAYFEQSLRGLRDLDAPLGVALAVSFLGLISHYLGDDETALGRYQEGLQVYEQQGDPFRTGVTLMYVADALVCLGRFEEAGAAYHQSLDRLRNLPHYAMDAVAGLARLSLAQGDLSQAQVHTEEVLSYLKQGNISGNMVSFGPFQLYLTCYRVLKAAGDPRARAVLQEAYRLLHERAAKISEEEEQRSYLENVTTNREIASEYAQSRGEMTPEQGD